MPIASAVSSPYEQISVDLTGPSESLHGCTLLTIIDYFSCYPETYILTRGDASEIVNCLHQSFACNGLPALLTSDNGSVFQSATFNEFLDSIGTKHAY